MTKSTTFYSNNARTTLSGPITSSVTTIPLISSVGFPSITPGTQFFFVTLDDGANIEIVKVGGISGNSLINCVRGQEGTTARAFTSAAKVENRLTAGNITQFARLQDRLRPVTSLELLVSPANSDGNSVMCDSLDAGGVPIVGLVSGTKWKFLNYPDLVKVGVAGSVISTTSMFFTSAGAILIDTTPNMYIIQFTGGANVGSCRFITVNSGTQSLLWTTPLPNAPTPADTYEIYRCISAFKAPTGGNTDRIFFENDINIWSDYVIPPKRNASSAGPVVINSGATVTIPDGSAWSII